MRPRFLRPHSGCGFGMEPAAVPMNLPLTTSRTLWELKARRRDTGSSLAKVTYPLSVPPSRGIH